MIGPVLRESLYRFRATFAQRWTGYVWLVVLVGLVGGISMAAIAGARRTQSAFPAFEASTHPSDLQAFTSFQPATGTGFSARVNQEIAHLPYVQRATPIVGFDGTLQILTHLASNGVPGEAPPALEGSPGDEYLTSDRVTLLRGRMLDASRLDEFMLSAGAVKASDLHLGSTVRIAFFSDAKVQSPAFVGYPTDKPQLLIGLKLVGIVENDTQVVQSDDEALGDQFGVLSSALTRRLEVCCAYYTYMSLQLEGGQRHAAAVGRAIGHVVPNIQSIGGYQTDEPILATAERAIRPEAIAFGVFGGVAALAALIINGQVLSRLIRRETADRAVLRAFGAGPAMTAGDVLGGALLAILAGALLAVAVAVALSPLAPIGAVRSVYPDKGVAFDWTVLGLGTLTLVAGLGVCAFVVAFRSAPHRIAARGTDSEARTGSARLSQAAAATGVSPSARLGLEAALGGAAGRQSAPVRSALIGTVVAVVLVVATIVFGSSLDSLVSQPAQYGWNWNYALLSGFSGAENLPGTTTASLLAHDPAVAHFTGVYFVTAKIDGQDVSTLAMRPGAPISPSQLSGQGLRSPGEIVLGPATLAALHKQIGQTVVLHNGSGRSYHLRIVGTATLPTIGASGQPTIGMGTGAVAATSLFSANDLNQQGSPIDGPMAELISLRPGAGSAAALTSLNHIVGQLNKTKDGPVGGVVSALRPAEIASYDSFQSTPVLMAAVLALAALCALGLTLTASVRSRRREFALLKALGFTRRQLASSVAWQSTVAAVLGVVVGVPVGIAIGRWLWTLFAHGIDAVPLPDVPVLGVVSVALGAIAFANVVALIPARIAAGTPTAVLLRSE